MKIWIGLGMLIGFLAMPNAASAQASCLSVDMSGAYAMMDNSCSTGIDFEWTDQGSCSGWRCSGYVGAHGRYSLGTISGQMTYFACYSPGGNGDVVARCDSSGQCYCWE